MTVPQMARYFREQERSANQKQAENALQQQKNKRTNNKRRTPNGSPKEPPSNNNNNKVNNKRNRINPDDPCPVHPNDNHTWGQCRANAYGEDPKGDKAFKKRRADKTAILGSSGR